MDLYVYAAIGLFGFLFVLISFVLGEVGHLGGDASVEFGHDMADGGMDHEMPGADHDHPGEAGDHEGPGPLSARVIATFMTTFGSVAAAARLSGLGSVTSATLGLATGYAVGWVAWRTLRFLWAQTGSSEVRTLDMVGCIAEVTVAIPATGCGQVACVVDGVGIHQIARSSGDIEIPLGTPVRILQAGAEGVLVEPAPAVGQPDRGTMKSL